MPDTRASQKVKKSNKVDVCGTSLQRDGDRLEYVNQLNYVLSEPIVNSLNAVRWNGGEFLTRAPERHFAVGGTVTN